jgi:aldose 1-epimerase
MSRRFWGKVYEKDVFLFTLTDGKMKAEITNYGGTVVSLWTPDRNGNPVDVVLGFETPEEYIAQKSYIGALIGRSANRIKGSRFALNGEEFLLEANEGQNQLHGGPKGFDKIVWEMEFCGPNELKLSYTSPDGEGGFPGNLYCTVEYRLEDGQLKILYTGVSDRDTVMNLTSHGYFNLNGHAGGTILDHFVSITADRFTEIDTESCSTGNILSVEGTPFDLRKPQKIGERLAMKHIQMDYGSGFDHNFVLDLRPGRPVADLYSPESGIGMEVYTDMEGMHFYTGNHLDGTLRGKGGAAYQKHAALCFETQHFPNAVNIAHFPSPVIKKDEVKKSMTSYRFYTK